MTAPPLRLEAVEKALAGRPVLRGLAFTVPAGQVTALLGPNGAGKTTTVALAAGLRRPDAGRVEVFGGDPARAATRARFSVVPQEIGFPDATSVGSCLRLVTGQRADVGLTPPVDELCAQLGLAGAFERRIGGLSGGQRRRLAVVLGLVHAPGLLVLDEATTNLDEATRAVTWRLVRDYAGRGGAALVTSHILADIEAHSDRVVALAEGRAVLDSPLAEVRARLGGSTVELDVPAERIGALRLAVAARGLGQERPPTAPGRLRWRTAAAMELVRTAAELAPEATGLTVGPTPLSELLDELAAQPPARLPEESPCAG